MPDGTVTPASYPGTAQSPSKPRCVIHSTRSGHAGNPNETIGTLRYCSDPNNGASYNWLISEQGDVYEMVGWLRSAWHATYLNTTHWGIALAQPTIDDPIIDAQHASLQWLMRELNRRQDVPLKHVTNERHDGFIEHYESRQGQASGKSDVGYRLKWTKLEL